MALSSELAALGLAPALARRLGADNNLAVTAAANNSATGATLLTSSNNLVTTSGASTNSVLLPSAERGCIIRIQLATGQTTLNIFPQSTETIIDEGAQGAAGAAVTLAATKVIELSAAGTTWWAVRGA